MGIVPVSNNIKRVHVMNTWRERIVCSINWLVGLHISKTTVAPFVIRPVCDYMETCNWSRNCFAHFSTLSLHCIFIMISMKKYGGKKIPAVGFRGNLAAIFDFRPLTKVHITSKPLLQMQ